jgi:hypothetical protein
MSDTFAFRRVPIPLRRRVSPRAVKVVAVVLVVGFAMSWFGRWVAASERASLQSAPRPVTSNFVDTLSGAPEAVAAGDTVAVAPDDRLARSAAREALAAARQIAHGKVSFVEAGPAQLAKAVPAVTFADGPSAAPQVVSVAAIGTAWAAAVMSTSGRCFYLRVDDRGRVGYGSAVTDCTGVAALSATDAAW